MGDLITFPLARSIGAMNYEITKKQLAERWRVSERWIELRVKHDDLPRRKDPYSRLVRFNLAECEQWLQHRKAS